MKLTKVSEIFDVKYGNSLSLSNLEQDNNGVPFISRTEKNNGISAKVKINNAELIPKNTISVSVGGSVMESFLQKEHYYTGYHILILHPKVKLTDNEMLYYCMCLRANKYRYSFGRQANKTLKDLEIPALDNIPSWVNESKIIYPNKNSIIDEEIKMENQTWKPFYLNDIFKIEKCKCSNASHLLKDGDDIFYIGAKKNNNGIMRKVKRDEKLVSKGNAIVFIGDGQGSVGYVTYQAQDFIGSTTLIAGYSNYLNVYNAQFLVTVLDLERYRYSFGRKYGKSIIEKSTIKLPEKENKPNWELMTNYIKSLQYASSL
ncbi:MAG: restriction endonuclease subunit S [Campylobacterota bacterium]|nr:restriction endonuclease subunit S [Campylobacterota bacterium]